MARIEEFGSVDGLRITTLVDNRADLIVVIVPTHCTGFRAISRFVQRMPDAFVLGAVGKTYLFDTGAE